LKDTPILILDEPTADVDRENEAKIIETIKEISKNKTTIIIAHRLSTIRDSDKIIVLNNGIISEEGTHEELMEKNSVYVNLVHHQLEHESVDIKEEMIEIYATVSGGGSARKPRDRRGSKDRGCTE
jgi:ABC-type transport system involved in cytochrome bd biosynthesis fused ATPase/permease subunit